MGGIEYEVREGGRAGSKDEVISQPSRRVNRVPQADKVRKSPHPRDRRSKEGKSMGSAEQ